MDDALDLDCGIATARITQWLDDELCLPRIHGAWVFSDQGRICRIEAIPLASRMLGQVAIERTHLVAHGDSEALSSFYKLFTLRFISAGG